MCVCEVTVAQLSCLCAIPSPLRQNKPILQSPRSGTAVLLSGRVSAERGGGRGCVCVGLRSVLLLLAPPRLAHRHEGVSRDGAGHEGVQCVQYG